MCDARSRSAPIAPPVFGRRAAGCPAEHLTEIIPAGETAVPGHCFHGHGGVQKQGQRMGKPQPGQISDRGLPGFPGKKPGEIGGGKPLVRRQLLYGKMLREMLFHVADAFLHTGRQRRPLRFLQGPQQRRQKAVNQISALIPPQLTAICHILVQVQPQLYWKAVRGNRNHRAEAVSYFPEKGTAAGP